MKNLFRSQIIIFRNFSLLPPLVTQNGQKMTDISIDRHVLLGSVTSFLEDILKKFVLFREFWVLWDKGSEQV